MAAPVPLTLRVNGQAHALVLDAEQPLLSVLRNDLGLNGPKYGCGLGECGACAVLVDGVLARACCLPAAGVAGRAVTTLEGLPASVHALPAEGADAAGQGRLAARLRGLRGRAFPAHRSGRHHAGDRW